MSWLHHLQCALRHKEQRRGEAAEEATQPATAYHASWDTAPCATQQRSSVGKRRAHRSRPRRHRGALRRDRQAWFPHGSPSIPWARTRRPRTSAARPAEPFSALCVTQGEPQRRAPHRNRTSPGADVAAGESSPGADVAAVSPSPGADVAVDAAPTSSCMRVFSNQNGLVMTAVAVPAISAERGAAAASDITCARPRMFADVCACGCLCLRARADCKLPCCFRGAVLVSPGRGIGRAGGCGTLAAEMFASGVLAPKAGCTCRLQMWYLLRSRMSGSNRVADTCTHTRGTGHRGRCGRGGPRHGCAVDTDACAHAHKAQPGSAAYTKKYPPHAMDEPRIPALRPE